MRPALASLSLAALLAAAGASPALRGQLPAGRTPPVMAWASDDSLLINNNGLLARFDLSSNKEELLDDNIIAFALQPGSRRAAAATPDEVSLRSYPDFEWLASLPLHEHPAAEVPPDDSVQALAWSPDGSTLAGGTASGHILLWDIEAGTPPAVPESGELWADLEVTPPAAVTQLSFSADGKRLLSVYEDARAVLWDLEKREELQRFAPAAPGEDQPAAEAATMLLSPDGRRLLHSWVRGAQAEMSLLDDTGRVRWRRAGLGVEFAPDGAAVLALVPPYRVAALYRLEDSSALRVFEPPEGVERLLAVRLNPAGTRLAGVTESRLGQGLVVWDAATGRLLHTRH